MTRRAFYNEIDRWCCDRLLERIATGDVPAGDVVCADIRTIDPATLEGYGQVHLFAGIGGGARACRLASVPDDFPIITAGVPCQPASHAGLRLGVNDPRWLWPDALRIIRALGSHYVLMENPPGLATLDGGEPFRGILGSLADMVRDCEGGSVSAADVGATHERERLWIIAFPMADSNGAGLGEYGRPEPDGPEQSAAQHGGRGGVARTVADSDSERREARDRERSPEPSVGGDADGVPAYLGGTEWPASPGEAQRPWEPPRLVDAITSDGRKALAAYGNAWVPQAAVPALRRILEHAAVRA